MGETMLNGLMMDDYPLSLTALVERAERFSGSRRVVSRRPDGTIHRTTFADCTQRARRLAAALADLGINDGDRTASLLWNQQQHLELYFAVPLMGAVIHTLNPRLHGPSWELWPAMRRTARSWSMNRCWRCSSRSAAPSRSST